ANRLSCLLVRHRLIFMLFGIAIGLLSVERSRHLEYSQSIDAMFDRSDSALPPFHRLGRTFGASSIVLAVYDEPELFQQAGFSRLEELTKRLSRIPGVHTATSLATTPLGAGIIDTKNNTTAESLVQLMEGYTVGTDRETAAVVCVLSEKEQPEKESSTVQQDRTGKTIDAIRTIMQEYPAGTIAGESVMLRDGFAMLRRDGNVLGITAGLLASVVLLVLFQSIRWLFAPLAVVVLALWSTRGLLATVGQKLTMVSTMLSAMITVVAIATTVHIIVEFRRRLNDGEVPQQALTNTIRTLFWPIIGAIITDIIGFGSLLASNVGPVHDFGIMTVIGAAMVLIAVGLVIPWFTLVGKNNTPNQDQRGKEHLDPIILFIGSLSIQNQYF
ncbi:MMPL family transporter, partial [Pirellulales bacterium]|nr:MMPL family transporter [Pirellulales bacterium]